MAIDLDGLEQFSVLSVGIDIGTSTSSVVFSQLIARRRGADLSGQFDVADRTLVAAGPMILTPYRDATSIDTGALANYIEDCYRNAGVRPDDVDTGVLVITGNAMSRTNAQSIAEHFASTTGRFVCVSAGPQHEALLAAHGSGAVALSESAGSTVMNIDVGGGTTKIAVVRAGRVVQTAALTVGARLVTFDCAGRIRRIEPGAHMLAERLDLSLRVDDRLPLAARDQLAELMTTLIFDAAAGGPSGGRLAKVLLTDPISPQYAISSADAVVMSGGVAEYLLDPEPIGHGDLGVALAARIQSRLDESTASGVVRRATQTARATVIGAGEHSLALSGVTNYISDPAALPAFGLQAVKVTVTDDADPTLAICSALRHLDRQVYGPGLVLALTFPSPPGYDLLRGAAEAITAAARGPLFVVIDDDRGMALGRILQHELGYRDAVVSLDGIRIGDLDFLDIGAPLTNSAAIPVTIKSLIFAVHDTPITT